MNDDERDFSPEDEGEGPEVFEIPEGFSGPDTGEEGALRTGRFGFVALMGPPNAGKSTLMNAFLGQKVAIVTPKPQTTRNRISGILTLDEAQVVFLDTPGVHRLRGRMNRFLLEAAFSALNMANAAVVVADAARYARNPGRLEDELGPLVRPLDHSALPRLVAVNKIDQVKDKKGLLPVMAGLSRLFPEAEQFPVSALKSRGASELLDRILGFLPQGMALYPEDQISDMPLRFMAAETVREKLFLQLRQELPYSTAVEIETWDEDPETGCVHINALIITARAAHKSMIIGKGGSMLKKVGSSARRELEEMLEAKVVLKLWVKVKEGWTEDAGFLRTLGLGE